MEQITIEDDAKITDITRENEEYLYEVQDCYASDTLGVLRVIADDICHYQELLQKYVTKLKGG